MRRRLVASGQFDGVVTPLPVRWFSPQQLRGPEGFYSGHGALAVTPADAQAIGFSILNNTYAGQLYQLVAAHLGRAFLLCVNKWGRTSRNQYALRASGTAYVYLGEFTKAGLGLFNGGVLHFSVELQCDVRTEVHFANGTVQTLSPVLFALLGGGNAKLKLGDLSRMTVMERAIL